MRTRNKKWRSRARAYLPSHLPDEIIDEAADVYSEARKRHAHPRAIYEALRAVREAEEDWEEHYPAAPCKLGDNESLWDGISALADRLESIYQEIADLHEAVRIVDKGLHELHRRSSEESLQNNLLFLKVCDLHDAHIPKKSEHVPEGDSPI